MENEYHNTDKWLKGKLQDTDPVWSEKAWTDFENRRNNKRRRIFWMYFLFSSIGLLIASGLLYILLPSNDQNNLAQQIHSIPNNTHQTTTNSANIGEENLTSNSVTESKYSQGISQSIPKNNNLLPTINQYHKSVETIRQQTQNENPILPKEPISAINSNKAIETVNNTITNNEIIPPVETKQQIENNIQAPKDILTDPIATADTPKLVNQLPNSKNDTPPPTHRKKNYIAIEYNPSQIIFANDLALPTTNYINANLSKKHTESYNNMGIAMGRYLNTKISLQTGVNIYSYTQTLNYTVLTENTQLVASPYTYFKMDTTLRRINKHTDTIYTTVKSSLNENRQSKVALQYISIPFNILYHCNYKQTQLSIGCGMVVQHLQKATASSDYNDDIKIAPWKINANIQLDADWKLGKALSIYTGYNCGYGISNKTNYLQHGFRTGLKLLF